MVYVQKIIVDITESPIIIIPASLPLSIFPKTKRNANIITIANTIDLNIILINS